MFGNLGLAYLVLKTFQVLKEFRHAIALLVMRQVIRIWVMLNKRSAA